MVLVIANDRLKILLPYGKKSSQLVPCNVRLTDSYFTFHLDHQNNNNQVTRVSSPGEAADGESDETALLVDDIIGCQLVSIEHVSNNCQHQNNSQTSVNTYSAFTIYAYPCKQSNLLTFSKSKKRIRLELTFVVDYSPSQLLNVEKASTWVRAIRWLKRDQSSILKGNTPHATTIPICNPKARRLLVLINPASGPGRAYSIYKEHVSPLLAEAGIEVTQLITKTSGGARTFIANAPIDQLCDGVVTISGDGLIFEVINGLMDRPDCDTVMMKVPLGIIPGGSGNGLAHSINYAVG